MFARSFFWFMIKSRIWIEISMVRLNWNEAFLEVATVLRSLSYSLEDVNNFTTLLTISSAVSCIRGVYRGSGWKVITVILNSWFYDRFWVLSFHFISVSMLFAWVEWSSVTAVRSHTLRIVRTWIIREPPLCITLQKYAIFFRVYQRNVSKAKVVCFFINWKRKRQVLIKV